MPEMENQGEGQEPQAPAEPQQPEKDAFGTEEHKPPEAAKPAGEKKFDPIPEDHPILVGLRQQLEAAENGRKEYGTNLKGQGDVIRTLKSKIAELEGKGKEGGAAVDVLYKPEDIKWSKDLTKEQRDEMTEAEIKQMDEIAALKEAQNKMYAALQKGEKKDGEEEVPDIQSWVKEEAKELSRGEGGHLNTELANQIIEAVKMFNLEGLDEKAVRERVGMAAKHVPDYKPPKEQKRTAGGKPVVQEGDKKDDPFGVDAIVEGVGKGSDGSYAL